MCPITISFLPSSSSSNLFTVRLCSNSMVRNCPSTVSLGQLSFSDVFSLLILAYPTGQLSPAKALQAALSAGCTHTAAPMHLRSPEFVTKKPILAFFLDSATICLLFERKLLKSKKQEVLNRRDLMKQASCKLLGNTAEEQMFLSERCLIQNSLYCDHCLLTSGTEHNHKSKFWKSGKQQIYSTIHFVLNSMKSRKPGLFCSPMFLTENELDIMISITMF